MEAREPRRLSLLGLLRALKGDTRTFIRQEIQLAKTELSEKLSSIGRNAAGLAIGGFVAYAGLIVFLMGLGFLIAWGLEHAGLEPGLAGFVGLAGIGLVVIITGSLLLLSGIKSLSQQSLAPQRTIYTLQELKGTALPGGPAPKQAQAEPKKTESGSSKELQTRVEATEERMSETVDELGRRLSPQHINAKVKERLAARPYRSGLLAMIAGLASGLLLRWRFRRA